MPPQTKFLNLVFPLGLYLLGAAIFFRWQLLSNFDLVFGNRGDARFVVFIHEHIYRWLSGHNLLSTPPFFFNQRDTLGYSEVFLLDQILYAPLRLLGTEPLLATSIVPIALSPLGYFFFYLFLRRFNVSMPLASVAALLFTFPNNLYLKSGHLQHFAVYYLPLIVYCGVVAASDLHHRAFRAYLLGGFAAGLYGLLFSTGYYIAWFFGLALLIFVPIAAPIAWPEIRAWWSKRPGRVVRFGAIAVISFLCGLSIFAIIYAPALALGMTRNFSEYVGFAPRPYDLFNVGMENLIWSKLIRAVRLIDDEHLSNGERWIALTPVVLLLTLTSIVLAFRRGFWPSDSQGRISRAVVIGSVSVCVLLFVLVVSVGTSSLFFLLYTMLPGANAIRAGYRCMIVANLFAATAIALTSNQAFSNHIFSFSSRQPQVWSRVGPSAALAALLGLSVVEQVNLVPSASLSQKYEREHFSAVGAAPRECRSFYVAPQPDHVFYEVQLDGMMIALTRHLPSLNGWSGFFPPGWDFYDTGAPDYAERALRWAFERDIANGLCRVDVKSGIWTTAPANRLPAQAP